MPTNADVFITIISETTGKTKTQVGDVLKMIRANAKEKDNFDAEISHEQYETLLDQLPKEKPGIMNYLLDGLKK